MLFVFFNTETREEAPEPIVDPVLLLQLCGLCDLCGSILFFLDLGGGRLAQGTNDANF